MSQHQQQNLHHPRQFQMMGGGHNAGGGGGGGYFGDTTYTKIFVGGLAWETQRDTMRRYFEQFGEIYEAVVITDKNTGRSKGYGFVTFKDPESAMRACHDPAPVIDGRRANCNLASLGAQRPPRPSPPPLHQHGRYRAVGSGLVTPPVYQGGPSAPYIHQQAPHYAYPYSAYGYSGYSQDNMYPMSYYNVYGGQQYPPYMTAASATGAASGVYPNFVPFYPQYAQGNQTQAYGMQIPQMVQYPYMPQPFSPTGIITVPASVAPATTTNSGVTVSESTDAPSTGPMSATQTAAEHSSSPPSSAAN